MLIRSISLFLLKLFFVSINLSYALAENTVVMPRLVRRTATWICWISYRNGYVELLVLYLQLLPKTWLIIEIGPA